MGMQELKRIGLQLAAFGLLFVGIPPAHGIPAFARKYGLAVLRLSRGVADAEQFWPDL